MTRFYGGAIVSTVVVCMVAGRTLALNVEDVQRVIWAVEITPIPGQPEDLLGAINVEGNVIPVVNFARRLGFPERELEPEDRIVIARQPDGSSIALVVDTVEGVLQHDDNKFVSSAESEISSGILNSDGEMILVIDVKKLRANEKPKAAVR